MTKRWEWVTGYEGRYKVSDHGEIFSMRLGRVMKVHLNDKGYPRASLERSGERKRPPVHRVVLETFVGPRPPGQQCRHLDGDKTNNKLSNLKWGSPKENTDDKHRHGTQERGLTDEEVLDLRARRRSGESYASIQKDYPLHINTLVGAATGKVYAHLPKETEVAVRAKAPAVKPNALLIRQLAMERHSYTEIAKRTGSSRSMIGCVVREERCLCVGDFPDGWQDWCESQVPPVKLTDSDVTDIRNARRNGILVKELAERFGVSAAVVCFASDGTTHKRVSTPVFVPTRKVRLTREKVLALRRRAMDGATATKLARELSLNAANVSRILNVETWRSESTLPPGYKEFLSSGGREQNANRAREERRKKLKF
jgi:hypothetical protein